MNRYTNIFLLWFVAISVSLTCQAAIFTGLGDFPEGIVRSGASGISGDGTTIVGGSAVLPFLSIEAAQWTTSWAISALRTDLSDDGFNRSASAASQDGSVIVGIRTERFPLGIPIQEAFRWTVADGIVGIGILQGDFRSHASDVSDNGEIIIGANGPSRAFRWTSDTGMVSLGTLPTNASSIATSHGGAMSANGSIIVGTSSSGRLQEAYRWTVETGMVGLGDLPGGSVISGAEGISADGSTIIGWSRSKLSQGSTEAYRWTAAGGMQGLGFLNVTDHGSSAEFVSSDGRLVFGWANGFLNNQWSNNYFVWDPLNGMRDFLQVLESEFDLAGDLAGWTSVIPQDISDDGLSIVGSGMNPDGNLEGWLIQLDHPIGIPEPTTLALIACGVLLLPHWRQRKELL